MTSTRFTTVAAAVSWLTAHNLRVAVSRCLSSILVASALAISVIAQPEGGTQKARTQSTQAPAKVTQSRESAASALASAKSTGSEVVGIVEFPTPMIPEAFDYHLGQGQIVAVYFRSLTTPWTGVSYSTDAAPIKGFTQAVERFSTSHRRANPDDNQSVFAVEAFAVRTTPDGMDQWMALVPGSQLAYARDLSQKAVEQLRGGEAQGPVVVYTPHQTEDAKALAGRPEQSAAGPKAAISSQASSDAFLPTSATLSIDAPSSDKRMISGSFSWSSEDALAGLKGLFTTLEIQVLFLNHSTDKSQKVTYTGDKIDFGVSWSDGYYDTTLLNGSNKTQGDPQEQEYAVGTTNASKFKPNTTYSFWISTKPGVLTANMVKFSAQKGKYVPGPGCDLKPELCVISFDAIGGRTEFISPLMPDGPAAQTRFSIVAPTAYRFTYPTQLCSVPPAQPELSTKLKSIPAPDAKILGDQMTAVLKAFKDNGGQPNVGCATTRLHEDTKWWPQGGKTQDFDGSQTGKGKGAIMLARGAGQAFWVHGAIWTRYAQMGGPKSVLGEPTGNEQSATSSRGSSGAYQKFKGGRLYFNGAVNKAFFVANAINQKYESVGAHSDTLGFPTSDEYAWNGGARSDFEGGYIYWTTASGAVIVRNQPRPAVQNYTWDSPPRAGQPFSGTVTGTGFVMGSTQLFFCVNGGTTCYEHPQGGVKVNNATSLRATNVSLSAGSWQLYVKTAAGSSERSAAFTVQPPPQPPTVSGYAWSTSPIAGRPFSGTVTGTNFASGDTQLWFCVNGSSSCYQHPTAGVNVNSPNSLSASNVNLGAGSWQLYVKTSAGQSARSATFNVAVPPVRPTITNYTWSSTPRADQSFGGTISGTGFITGGTQVYFCLSGTSTCYQHPSAGVTVNSSKLLSVSNVRLDSGAWQIYVQTSAGQSDRSSSFAVFIGSPSISGYSWSTTPRASQFFSGTISGSNFVPGGTQVWFCVAGSSTCYQHPSAGVTVNSTTRLSVSSVKLGAGSWQVYLQTYAGTSSRSSTFTVR